MSAVEAKYKAYENPHDKMILNYGGNSLSATLKSNSHTWTHANDVAIICALYEKGYGNWVQIHKCVTQRDSMDVLLDYFLLTRTVEEVRRRRKSLMQVVKK